MRRVTAVVVAVGGLLVGTATQAAPSGSVGGGGIGASAGSESPSEVPDTTNPATVCTWGADQLHYGSGRTTSGGHVFAYIDQLYWRINPMTGEVWVQSLRVCRQEGVVVSTGLGWRRVVAPDPRVLGESLYDEVVEQVPVPVPALSPVGPGFVNLGMWLAVVEPERVSVTARAGSVWATTSAELVSTRFEMGDESVVVCDGAGDPIPVSALGSVEASPVCGHTYRGVNGGVPFEVTVTSTWRVWWVGSGGAGGELGTLDREAELDYEVREIQTVGG
jgi:hypothetical protein